MDCQRQSSKTRPASPTYAKQKTAMNRPDILRPSTHPGTT